MRRVYEYSQRHNNSDIRKWTTGVLFYFIFFLGGGGGVGFFVFFFLFCFVLFRFLQAISDNIQVEFCTLFIQGFHRREEPERKRKKHRTRDRERRVVRVFRSTALFMHELLIINYYHYYYYYYYYFVFLFR